MGFLREPSHVILVVLVLVVLFGSRRLPDAARGLGQSMRILKKEMQQMKDEDKTKDQGTSVNLPETEPPLEGRVVRPQAKAERDNESGYQARRDV